MNIRHLFVISIFIAACCQDVKAQQYPISVFAFSIYNDEKQVESLNRVVSFEDSPRFALDTSSLFSIKAVYYNEDTRYHRIAKHKTGIWLLYAEDVRKHRPLRFFSIEKKVDDGKIQVMTIFLNYNYHSCEMPCAFGKSDFKVCQIPFKQGNFMLTDRTSLADWTTNDQKIVQIEGDLLYHILKNKVELWDSKRKN